jgi:predicted helicase
MFKDFHAVEAEIASQDTTKGKGDLFEIFAKFYFMYFSVKYQVLDVFIGSEIPTKLKQQLKLESSDYGVDGVATLMDGGLLAFQVKFRSGRESPTARELAMFWSESKHADQRIVFTNANTVPKVGEKHSLSILGTDLELLDEEFFKAFGDYLEGSKVQRPQAKSPLPYQKKMIDASVSGLREHSKGKLIAACGTGKTLVSLWIAEELQSRSVVFFAPSLALIKQTLDSWSTNTKKGFRYLAVCSDSTVTDEVEKMADYSANELDFSVTTNPSEIATFITNSGSSGLPSYIFCTYQSSEALVAALEKLGNPLVDLAIFDEAHKTAGASTDYRLTSILKGEHLVGAKRLFMTATERLVAPWIVSKSAEEDRVVFSMDDESVYGPNLHTYNFGDAISDGVIANYKVLAVDVPADEIREVIESKGLLEDDDSPELGLVETSFLYKQAVLAKAIKAKSLSKIVTFHSDISRAKTFVYGSMNHSLPLTSVFVELGLRAPEFAEHIDGKMTTDVRKELLSSFAQSTFGVVSNARCLTEGVDVPVIDAIYFADPKSSLVDIVQAVGRALRKPFGVKEKTAYLVIPALYSDNGELLDETFTTLIKVIQALAAQDQRLAQWIEKINLEHARGTRSASEHLALEQFIEWPTRIDFKRFGEEIEVKIVDSLVGPPTEAMQTALSVRRSEAPKVFRPIADYAAGTVFERLVDPTLKSCSKNWLTPKSDLPHNAISHSLRLGVIERNADGQIRISDQGESYLSGSVGRDDVFRRACLDYAITETSPSLKPYTALRRVLEELGEITFHQFVFGPYTLQNGSESEISRVVSACKKVNEMYPNLDKISPSNREIALADLNKEFETDYALSEIWGSTTVKNRFGYFKSHLSLFPDIRITPKSLVWSGDEERQ